MKDTYNFEWMQYPNMLWWKKKLIDRIEKEMLRLVPLDESNREGQKPNKHFNFLNE